jgi:hypothetical protein
MRGDGVLSWGASANQGSLTWDTGYAIVKALSGQQLHLGGGNADSNIVIDTSGNVGIGTTSPSAKLHVSGTVANNREFQVGNDYLVVTGSNGNVGIGTTSPQSSLHVDSNGTGTTSNGITLRNSTNQLHYWYLEDNTTSVFDIGSVSGLYKFKAPVFFSSSIEVNDGNQLYFSGQSGDYASISFTDDDPDGWLFSYKQNSGQTAFLKFSSTSEAAGDGTITMGTTGNNFHINNGGNVGIGTTSPSQKLTVAGTISGSSDLSIDGNSIFDGTVGYNTFNSGFRRKWLENRR